MTDIEQTKRPHFPRASVRFAAFFFPTATPRRADGSPSSARRLGGPATSEPERRRSGGESHRDSSAARQKFTAAGERHLSRHRSARELSSASAGLSSPLGRLIRMSVSTSSWMQLKCDMPTATQPSSSAQFATRVSCSLINPVCSRPTKENIDD